MEKKALENLEAARVLLGQDDACTNAATSRAYYAAYHACWALMEDRGHDVPITNRGRYFGHKDLPGHAHDAAVLSLNEAEQLEFLESQRVVADCYQEDVSARIARDCVVAAEALVARLEVGR